MKKLIQLIKNPQVIVLLSYLSLVVLLRWHLSWDLIGWLIGGFVGWGLVVADRLVWVYWTRPQTQLSVQIRYLINNRKFKETWQTLMARKKEQTELTFRSALFQVVWVPLAFFAITSTANLFGKALVMGLGLHLLYDEWKDFRQSPELLRSWLFWQIKRSISLEEQKSFLLIMTGAFLLLSWLLI